MTPFFAKSNPMSGPGPLGAREKFTAEMPFWKFPHASRGISFSMEKQETESGRHQRVPRTHRRAKQSYEFSFDFYDSGQLSALFCSLRAIDAAGGGWMIEYSASAAHGNSLLWKLRPPDSSAPALFTQILCCCVQNTFNCVKNTHARRRQSGKKKPLPQLVNFSLYYLKLACSRVFQIQLLGFNSQLYSNFSDALNRAQGIVGVSLLLQVRKETFALRQHMLLRNNSALAPLLLLLALEMIK